MRRLLGVLLLGLGALSMIVVSSVVSGGWPARALASGIGDGTPEAGSVEESVAQFATPAPANVFVSSQADANIDVIDTVTNQVTTLPAHRSNGVTVTPNGRFVYVSQPFLHGDLVSVVDVLTGTTVADIPGINDPGALFATPDGREVWVLAGMIWVIDTATNAIVDVIDIGGVEPPRNMVFSPDGTRAYVSTGTFNTRGNVTVVDTASRSVAGVVVAGRLPAGIDVTPDGSHVYVANVHSRDVYVIDTATLSVVTRFPLGTTPSALRLTPDGTKGIVSAKFSDAIVFFDTALNQVDGSVSVANFPQGLGIDPAGARAYVSGFFPHPSEGCFTSVVDIALRIVVEDLPTSCGAGQIAVGPPPSCKGLVEALVADGTLNAGQGRALNAKLEAAEASLERGNDIAAVNQLIAFTNQVQALINAGILMQTQGQPLIDCANAVVDRILAGG